MHLRGHFNGQHIVLDQPAPPELQPNTPVEIVPLDVRGQTLRELEDFLNDLWSKPVPSTCQLPARRWVRVELYERGGKDLS